MLKGNPGIEGMVEYLDDLSSNFNALGRGVSSIEYLVELGKKLKSLPEEFRIDKNRVPGCVSNVYIYGVLEDNKMHYQGSSDSAVVAGYVTILSEAFDGLRPNEIVEQSRSHIEKFLEETDIKASLTMSRANALGNIYKVMVKQAAEYIKE